MQYYLNLFTRILLLRAAPDEVPASPALFWLAFFILLGLAVLKGAFVFTPLTNLTVNFIYQVSVLLFVYLLLLVVGRQRRFLQTIIAVLGVSILFHILDFPAYGLVESGLLPDEHILVTASALYYYVLVVYSVLVFGHILRDAMELPIVAGVAIALAYCVASIWVVERVFPELTA